MSVSTALSTMSGTEQIKRAWTRGFVSDQELLGQFYQLSLGGWGGRVYRDAAQVQRLGGNDGVSLYFALSTSPLGCHLFPVALNNLTSRVRILQA